MTEPKLSKPRNQKIIGLRQRQIVADLTPFFSVGVYDRDLSVFSHIILSSTHLFCFLLSLVGGEKNFMAYFSDTNLSYVIRLKVILYQTFRTLFNTTSSQTLTPNYLKRKKEKGNLKS